MIKIGVVREAGYAGVELLRLLAAPPAFSDPATAPPKGRNLAFP